MTKTIEINDKKMKFNTGFKWMIIYKAEFGVDVSTILVPVLRDAAKDQTGYAALEALGFVNIVRIAWACAKLADNNIESFDEWIENMGDFSVVDLATEILPAVFESFNVKKK